MADYKKMYAILCGTIDDVLDELNQIPAAMSASARLQKKYASTAKGAILHKKTCKKYFTNGNRYGMIQELVPLPGLRETAGTAGIFSARSADMRQWQKK